MLERRFAVPICDETEQMLLKRYQNALDACDLALQDSREAYKLALRSAVKRVRPEVEVDNYWTWLGSDGKSIGLMLKEND
jgi:hypothetical protein